MAKHTPRSEASDSAAAAPETQPTATTRVRRRPGGTAAGSAPGENESRQDRPPSEPNQPEETYAARTEPTDQPSEDLGAPAPSVEEIRLRAYHRYLERGGGHGLDFDDWVEAERELLKK